MRAPKHLVSVTGGLLIDGATLQRNLRLKSPLFIVLLICKAPRKIRQNKNGLEILKTNLLDSLCFVK